MYKVLITDKISKKALKIFKKNGIKAIEKIGLNEEEIIKELKGVQGIVIRSQTKINKNIILKSKSLKVIGRAGIGVDNIDIEAAKNNKIVILNTPFGNSISAAEHTIALILSLARQIPYVNKITHEGKWEKSKLVGVEVSEKTLGIIGFGNIGSLVASKALGLNLKVIVYDPFLQFEKAKLMNVEKVKLNELFQNSDFISLHTPLTEKTKNIINKNSFKLMKKGIRIINCARGGLIEELALKKNLENGHVAGAALDVYNHEPINKNNPLLGTKNLILTPHIGASTEEAQERVGLQIAEQISEFLITGKVINSVK